MIQNKMLNGLRRISTIASIKISTGVKITLFKGTNKLDSNRQFLPISARLGVFEQFETVKLSSGLKIHYLYDAPYDKATGHNKSISGAIASAVSTCAIIYRDEMYDVRKGKNWTFDAPIFGIPFGARHISVHIEVPEDFAIVPDAYRQFLDMREASNHTLVPMILLKLCVIIVRNG